MSELDIPTASIKGGWILYLSDYDDYYVPKDYDLEPGVFDHLVMVLHIVKRTQDIVVCLLTTLRSTNIEDREDPTQSSLYLGIYPKPAPCPAYPQLRLAGNVSLRKPGCICIQRRYVVHRSLLEKYDRNKPLDLYRLTDESYAVVAELLGVRPEIETQDADEEKTAIEEKIIPRLKKPKIDSISKRSSPFVG